ncbi:MAG: hypothetical protein P8N19_12805 [Flavobacteriales bacterium]|nr:hypothetical protein [Flavobacteriales bacterium]MDG1765920.1 hypothetical protein [Flavobacteriales bacterium]
MIHFFSIAGICFALFALLKQGKWTEKLACFFMALALLNRTATTFFFQSYTPGAYMLFILFLLLGTLLTAITGLKAKPNSPAWIFLSVPLFIIAFLWSLSMNPTEIKALSIFSLIAFVYILVKKRPKSLALISAAFSISIVAFYYFSQFIEYSLL